MFTGFFNDPKVVVYQGEFERTLLTDCVWKSVGGELEFMSVKGDVSQVRGTAVIFPSFLVHRVAPVISGVRKSLVSWISGPPFK